MSFFSFIFFLYLCTSKIIVIVNMSNHKTIGGQRQWVHKDFPLILWAEKIFALSLNYVLRSAASRKWKLIWIYFVFHSICTIFANEFYWKQSQVLRGLHENCEKSNRFQRKPKATRLIPQQRREQGGICAFGG